MNYLKVYDQIIERAKGRKLKGYKEKHHIVPKCLGGTDNKDNIVELTAREHFICHWLLARGHNTQVLWFAFRMMFNASSNQNRYTPSSRAFEEAKLKHSKFISKVNKGNKPPCHKGRVYMINDSIRKQIRVYPDQVEDKMKEGYVLGTYHKPPNRKGYRKKLEAID